MARQREADSIFTKSYRLQANVAGLPDRVEVHIWSASREAGRENRHDEIAS